MTCLDADYYYYVLVVVRKPLTDFVLGNLKIFAFLWIIFFGSETYAAQRKLRVLVAQGDQLNIRADGRKPLFIYGKGFRGKRVRRIKVDSRKGKSGFFFDSSSDKKIPLTTRDQLIIRSHDSRGIWVGNRRYRGELRIKSLNQSLYLVNYLGIEKYLASVVGSEMPKDWPIEALKAQAIAARTYALKQKGKLGFYDIRSTEASQVYLGVESENERIDKAVNQTKSLVMKHNGKLINAVFHSSSGGLTERSEDVWKQQLPYLVSVVDNDHHSPKHRWDLWFTYKDLLRIFPDLKGVKNIEPVKLSDTGRILLVRIEGPEGVIFLNGNQLRTRLGLKSTLVRFKMISSNTFRDSFYPKFFSSDSTLTPKLPTEAMRSSKGFWRDWSLGGEPIFKESLPTLTMSPPLLKRESIFKPKSFTKQPYPLPPLPLQIKYPMLFVRGFGAGHGVGMSQWGANDLAEKGYNYKSILNHYYKGIAIRKYN